MLEAGFAAEVLPTSALAPRSDQILIRTGESVLQVEQTRNQARRTEQTPGTGEKELHPAGFEDRPVDQLGQFDLRMFEIDRLRQGLLKQAAGRESTCLSDSSQMHGILQKLRRCYLVYGKLSDLKSKN